MVSALCILSNIHFHINFVCNNITIIILRNAIKNCNTVEFNPCNFMNIALFRNRMIVQGFHFSCQSPVSGESLSIRINVNSINEHWAGVCDSFNK